MNLCLTFTTYQVSGEFLPGELAYRDGEIFICVETNTASPLAFRLLFKKSKSGLWVARHGGLHRFGYQREFQKVLLGGGECIA